MTYFLKATNFFLYLGSQNIKLFLSLIVVSGVRVNVLTEFSFTFIFIIWKTPIEMIAFLAFWGQKTLKNNKNIGIKKKNYIFIII